MHKPRKKVFLIEDDELARDTLKDSLGDEFDFGLFGDIENLHDELIGKNAPDYAFIDIQLFADPTAGFRALELFRGLSPRTVTYLVSSNFSKIEEIERLRSWPSLRGLLRKGELSICMSSILEDLEKASTEISSADEDLPSPKIEILEEVKKAIHPLGLNIEAAVALAFPFDSFIDVIFAVQGLSGAIGLGILVRGSAWRSENSFYFLKIEGGRDASRKLTAELENYRNLRRDMSRVHFPKCFGIVQSTELSILIYEYVGVAPKMGRGWRPIHFDEVFKAFTGEGLRGRNQLRRALEPLGELLNSPSGNLGPWFTETNHKQLTVLREKAAKSVLRRLGRSDEKADIDGILNVEFLRAEELEDILFVEPERGIIENPLRRLRFLDSEPSHRSLSLGTIHGDLHSRNLVYAQMRPAPEGPRWMLIDFEHVRSRDLQMLDAARLECDLLFERMPLRSLESSYSVARYTIFDAAGLDSVQSSQDPELHKVEQALVVFHDFISTAFEEKWRSQAEVASIHMQYLYALLYESVRWLTHRASPIRFLQRLFYGSLICEALNELSKKDVN